MVRRRPAPADTQRPPFFSPGAASSVRSGTLGLHRGGESFDQLGGLDNLKLGKERGILLDFRKDVIYTGTTMFVSDNHLVGGVRKNSDNWLMMLRSEPRHRADKAFAVAVVKTDTAADA